MKLAVTGVTSIGLLKLSRNGRNLISSCSPLRQKHISSKVSDNTSRQWLQLCLEWQMSLV
jgi:hypothetical protein